MRVADSSNRMSAYVSSADLRRYEPDLFAPQNVNLDKGYLSSLIVSGARRMFTQKLKASRVASPPPSAQTARPITDQGRVHYSSYRAKPRNGYGARRFDPHWRACPAPTLLRGRIGRRHHIDRLLRDALGALRAGQSRILAERLPGSDGGFTVLVHQDADQGVVGAFVFVGRGKVTHFPDAAAAEELQIRF